MPLDQVATFQKLLKPFLPTIKPILAFRRGGPGPKSSFRRGCSDVQFFWTLFAWSVLRYIHRLPQYAFLDVSIRKEIIKGDDIMTRGLWESYEKMGKKGIDERSRNVALEMMETLACISPVPVAAREIPSVLNMALDRIEHAISIANRLARTEVPAIKHRNMAKIIPKWTVQGTYAAVQNMHRGIPHKVARSLANAQKVNVALAAHYKNAALRAPEIPKEIVSMNAIDADPHLYRGMHGDMAAGAVEKGGLVEPKGYIAFSSDKNIAITFSYDSSNIQEKAFSTAKKAYSKMMMNNNNDGTNYNSSNYNSNGNDIAMKNDTSWMTKWGFGGKPHNSNSNSNNNNNNNSSIIIRRGGKSKKLKFIMFKLALRDVPRGTPWLWFSNDSQENIRRSKHAIQSTTNENEVLLPPGKVMFKHPLDRRIASVIAATMKTPASSKKSTVLQTTRTGPKSTTITILGDFDFDADVDAIVRASCMHIRDFLKSARHGAGDTPAVRLASPNIMGIRMLRMIQMACIHHKLGIFDVPDEKSDEPLTFDAIYVPDPSATNATVRKISMMKRPPTMTGSKRGRSEANIEDTNKKIQSAISEVGRLVSVRRSARRPRTFF